MVIHKGVPGYPIIVVANRDEYYDRPTQGPHQLAHTPAIWGGRDTRAGGTWLGVNTYGLAIGLTNRRIREDQENDPQRRSAVFCVWKPYTVVLRQRPPISS